MRWRKAEREGAQLTGSRLHFNSGRGFEKFDYSNGQYLTDHKYTQKDKYEIRMHVWNPLGRAAYRQKKKPRMIITFSPSPGREVWVEVVGPHFLRRGGTIKSDGSCTCPELQTRIIER